MDYSLLHLPYLTVDEEAVPEALPEVPAEAGETVEEAKAEEVAETEVGKGIFSNILHAFI